MSKPWFLKMALEAEPSPLARQIADVLRDASNAEAGCRELVDLALAGGGRDNVTVVVANALRT